MYNIGVIFGRFQPFHNGHLEYVIYALSKSKFIYIGITNPDPILSGPDDANSDRSDPSANPCTYYERLEMIASTLRRSRIPSASFAIVPFPINKPSVWNHYVPKTGVYFLDMADDKWSRRKLELIESMGLKVDLSSHKSKIGITATDVRYKIKNHITYEHLIPDSTLVALKNYGIIERIIEDQ